jgi:hypothetical protein
VSTKTSRLPTSSAKATVSLEREPETLSLLRRALLAILLFGVVGMVAELLMLRHTEGFWQLAPLALLAAALPVLAWSGVRRSAASVRTLQLLMGTFLLSGLAGVVLHYQGNAVYEMESMPGVGGWELFVKAVMGASPTLAPGSMLLLGLVGLVYTFRHPALR